MSAIEEVDSGKPRILVVDDDSDLRLTLCEFLQSRNFVVSSARNGSDAISLIQSKKHAFDIIFTDLVMAPGPDGVEVLKVAKQLSPLSCVVIMTGYSSIGTAMESIRSGAFDYVSKPFKLAEIEILANRIIEYLALLDDNKRSSFQLRLRSKSLDRSTSRENRGAS